MKKALHSFHKQVAIAPQPLYQPYQLTYTHQPLSYSPAAIAVPYNHQQQIIPIAHANGYNGYQLAAIPHQQVQISQPYSYVTSATSETGKVICNTNDFHFSSDTLTQISRYQHRIRHKTTMHITNNKLSVNFLFIEESPTIFYNLFYLAFPTYQHVAAPINIPTTQKFVAFPSYSPAQVYHVI